MQITEGLFDHMVLQRNARGVSDAVLRGTCSGAGRVTARVDCKGKVLRGFAEHACGRAGRRSFTARLGGLPAGGPYDITLHVRDAAGQPRELCRVRDVLVGDVWIVGGQSNMQGCGRQEHRARPDPQVRAFFMDDRWRVARDPIHNMNAAVDAVHKALCGGTLPPPERVLGVGPGVAFGQEMRRRTGVPQGLLACAHGGTSMAQWNPARKAAGGDSLYGATVRRLRKNGGRVAGVIWYQGESDAHPAGAAAYSDAMCTLVRAFRRDARDPALPVVLVQLARVISRPPSAAAPWNKIQDLQRRLPRLLRGVATVPAIDLRLEDVIHIEGSEQNRLGRRLAGAMDVLRRGRAAGLPPIELGAIRTELQPDRNLAMIVVEFKHVVGGLRSGSRPTGFSLGEDNPGLAIIDTRLEKNLALLYVSVPPTVLGAEHLYYGFGLNPICNITDAADRSLPVFARSLGAARAFTPFCRVFDVAHLPLSYARLGARCPQGLSYQRWTSPADFADSRQIHPAWPREDGCLVYRATIDCPAAMRLDLLVGYDGPVSAWVNGKRVVRDPAGTNPAVADQASATFAAAAGRHEVVLALGNQQGRAWGLMVRFARRDVTRKQFETGQPAYAMPAWC